MSKVRFLIIDDDYGICQMLSNIIEDNDLGEVIDMITCGTEGINMIPKFRPDIVFVDLLLPDIDGIEIVKSIRKKYKDIDFIMISQVSDNGMISDAYESGIEFYINKPINVIEVVSVTKKIIISQRNRRVIEQIGKTLSKNAPKNTNINNNSLADNIKVIFAELGILSEKGSPDLIEMILMVVEDRQNENKYNIQISNLYSRITKNYQINGILMAASEKAIEQRVRRAINIALVNIANLGIEDFGNYKFDMYASSLFGFQEVKKIMDSIRSNGNLRGTINIKSFINGVISLIEIY